MVALSYVNDFVGEVAYCGDCRRLRTVIDDYYLTFVCAQRHGENALDALNEQLGRDVVCGDDEDYQWLFLHIL